jgi:hypothetical protein
MDRASVRHRSPGAPASSALGARQPPDLRRCLLLVVPRPPQKFSRLTALLLVAPSLPAAEAITSVRDEMLAPIDQGGERAWGARVLVLGNDFFGLKNDVLG